MDLTPGGDTSRALYVHVPFCARKCDYCAFYSDAELGLTDRYLEALLHELAGVAAEVQPDTLFFGGGTPTLLTVQQWERLLKAIHQGFPIPPTEWTVECNPATLSVEKAKLLREGGVNRISLGVQSLDENLLARLGRIHSRESVFRSFDLLRTAGFDNINLDLMFAIPGQTLAVWRKTVIEALSMGSEHLACYEVIYEEDTPLFQELQAGRFEVDDDLAAVMYETLVELCINHGFRRYEVANFARDDAVDSDVTRLPTRACHHNVTYWRGRPFHGLGPSASTFIHGVRSRNIANTRRYCEFLEQGKSPVESRDHLPPRERAGEIAAFGLRMDMGWGFDEFRLVTGFGLRETWPNALHTLVERHWGELSDTRFRLTPEGLRFADAVAELFLGADAT